MAYRGYDDIYVEGAGARTEVMQNAVISTGLENKMGASGISGTGGILRGKRGKKSRREAEEDKASVEKIREVALLTRLRRGTLDGGASRTGKYKKSNKGRDSSN